MARILIAGCGDVGGSTGLRFAAAGHEVFGLRRNIGSVPEGIQPIAADLGDAGSLVPVATREFDLVVVSTSAGAFSPEAYQRVYVDGLVNLLNALSGAPRLLLVSSTGVYHQQQGEWVDEHSATEPTGFSGQALLRAERLLAERAPAGYSIVRFGGIYGPGRNRLLNDVRAGIGCPAQPVQYTNRIHRDDCAGSLYFLGRRLLDGVEVAPLYLGVDDDPAPMWEVRHWIAARLGVTLDDRAGRASARGGNKRCSNALLKAAGYEFAYPDFRSGYEPMIRALQGRA